jgi:hypothetical protein
VTDAPRTLARCTETGNCPSVEQLPDGRIAVTGQWHCADPDTGETTVTIPAQVFHDAAKAWLDDGPTDPAVTEAKPATVTDYRAIRREQHPRHRNGGPT